MKGSMILLTIGSYLVLAFTLLDFQISEKTEALDSPRRLVVHEWGTFTSVAGAAGAALDWRPLNGASDLPAFVYTDSGNGGFRGTYHDPGKSRLARVRMETPVIYFYTGLEMEVSVSVEFPHGNITEWYPQASVVNMNFEPGKKGRFDSGINWGTIKLLPYEKPNFLREAADSHYYPARQTDAVAVQVCNADKSLIEKEKFLFYRGIGNFELPLTVSLVGPETKRSDHLLLANDGQQEIRNLIVFENSGGRIGFRMIERLAGEKVLVKRPDTNRSLRDVLDEMRKILVAEGLYEKEAAAMIETWRDFWFEEGLRVFYVLPAQRTNEILPLKIEPAPAEIVRVMVGRTEIITPETEQDVKKQIGLLKADAAEIRAKARESLARRGRFFEPVLRSILQSETDEEIRTEIRKLIDLN